MPKIAKRAPGGGRSVNIRVPIVREIATILNAADPMQALIDAMSFVTKPDYMYGGDEAAGATEIGGSGYDLTPSGAIDQEQSSSVLGSGNFSVFDADTDTLSNTTDSALQPGTGSFAVLWVGNLTAAHVGNYVFADVDPTLGWGLFARATGEDMRFYLWTASGLSFVSLPNTVPINAGEVMLAIKDATALDSHLHTGTGTVTNSSIYDESVNSASQRFAIGDTGTGDGARQEFGIAAMWKGAAAESLTQTHRNNLAAYLGY